VAGGVGGRGSRRACLGGVEGEAPAEACLGDGGRGFPPSLRTRLGGSLALQPAHANPPNRSKGPAGGPTSAWTSENELTILGGERSMATGVCVPCKVRLNVPDSLVGKNVRCPKCKGVVSHPRSGARRPNPPPPVAKSPPPRPRPAAAGRPGGRKGFAKPQGFALRLAARRGARLGRGR